jgi:hypothetical protein
MEPSIREQAIAELAHAVSTARREGSDLLLDDLACVIGDALHEGEALLLAYNLIPYEEERIAPDVDSL